MRRSAYIALICLALLALAIRAPGADASHSNDPAAPDVRAADQLTFLSGRISPSLEAAIAELPANITVVTGLSPDEALARAAEFHGMDARYCNAELMAAATNLRWVQSPSAGVDRYLKLKELRERDDIVFTNMQGVHGPTIADHVFATLLALTRDLPHFHAAQRRGDWNRGGSGSTRIALQDRTLLVVGLGGIGREVAKRGKGFGMRVLATRRRDVAPPPYVDRQGRPADLPALLAESDVVVLCVPLTDETTGLIGAEELELMPKGSYLVNIARGPVVDTGALIEALESGHLAGAALDVTDPEPLPPGHPLWSAPNVIITPHVASHSALTGAAWDALYIDNLRRFANGEALVNVVDKAAGY